MSKLHKTLVDKEDSTVEIYPNIETENIPDQGVTSNKIADESITHTKLAEEAVRNDNIPDEELSKDKLKNALYNIKCLCRAIYNGEYYNFYINILWEDAREGMTTNAPTDYNSLYLLLEISSYGMLVNAIIENANNSGNIINVFFEDSFKVLGIKTNNTFVYFDVDDLNVSTDFVIVSSEIHKIY